MRAIIFANGNPPDIKTFQRWSTASALIIAADGGTHNALSIEVRPHVIIGDMDSFDLKDRGWLEKTGAKFIVYPDHKDLTDLELAIRYAVTHGTDEIVILSALGGRWDQTLANMMLLGLPELKTVRARIVDRDLSIVAVWDRIEIEGRSGDGLSLIPIGGAALGVSIEGCEYPLNDAVLPFAATLGISNMLIEPIARVSVKEGIVLAIHTTRAE
jgi:thiamine pyrophosphokinase